MTQSRLSARSARVIATVGFWALIAIAAVVRDTPGLVIAYFAFAWLAVFSLLAWKSQDEFERAAQKFSWVFGGLFGLMGSLALLPFVTQPGIATPLLEWLAALLGPPGDPVGLAMVLGAIWIVLGQLVGFLVCWVGWHVTKR